MNRKPLPPQHLLKERYDYDEHQGHLINRKNMSGRGGGIGSLIGRIDKAGRRRAYFNGSKYFEYNLIWMWYYGEDIPEHLEVDHIDNDRDNNKIENLRLVTHGENQLNRIDTKRNGCLWKDNPVRIEKDRKRTLSYYHNLSPEEKRERNRKNYEQKQRRTNDT